MIADDLDLHATLHTMLNNKTLSLKDTVKTVLFVALGWVYSNRLDIP